jgi:hypothetical protein
MTEFGRQLRTFRHRCNDQNSPHGKLTQEKFGEFIGEELGIDYTGAAISDWEREKTRIHAEDRPLLLAIIKVLHEYGGLRTINDANQLLNAGHFSSLDPKEERRIFKDAVVDIRDGQSAIDLKASKPLWEFVLGSLLSIPEDEFKMLIANAEKGPRPSQPRIVVFLLRRFTDRISINQALKFILWIWVWLLAWVLITPSLRWPFANTDYAWLALFEYTGGSILVPALIGVLTNTNDNEFWRKQPDVKPVKLRLFTHQGASIGFHVGYFFVFMIDLLLYNFGWPSMTWIELVPAAFLIFLGYAGARLIPYNLFAAFQRLKLRDGWIFFVFVLVGPAWAYFFFQTYDILLTRALGIFIVLAALTILVVMMSWRYRQSGTTVIPLRWWIIFWISFLLCQLLLLWLTQVV